MSKICVADFQKQAETIIERTALDYYRSGAGEELTLKLNRESFNRLRLRPRFLRDVSVVNTKCNIFGMALNWPVGIAPTALQKMAHRDGEAATARAAGCTGSVFTLSTLSTTSIEDIASAAPNTFKWFQLYVYKDRSLTEQMVRRAERSNFKAIVLTVDAPIFGQRYADIRNKFSVPKNLILANFEDETANGVHSDVSKSSIYEYVSSQFDATLSWEDVAWLIKLTSLPVIVKGILTSEDAILAREVGVAGIIVSNHGARQLDTVPASIEVLPEIVQAVGKDVVVMLDGGITRGTDILKAIALGAKMVFVGRAVLWGLACGGQRGVEDLLQILKKDFEIAMKLTGCKKLVDINDKIVVHQSHYSRL